MIMFRTILLSFVAMFSSCATVHMSVHHVPQDHAQFILRLSSNETNRLKAILIEQLAKWKLHQFNSQDKGPGIICSDNDGTVCFSNKRPNKTETFGIKYIVFDQSYINDFLLVTFEPLADQSTSRVLIRVVSGSEVNTLKTSRKVRDEIHDTVIKDFGASVIEKYNEFDEVISEKQAVHHKSGLTN